MTLPRPARILIAIVFACGVATLVGAAREATTARGVGPLVQVLFLAILVAGSWLWPLILYRGPNSSEAHHFDEGLLVIMVLLLPPAGTVLAFALATVAAQVGRRRPLVKSAFNFGQITVAVGLAVATVQLIAPPTARLSAASVGAAALGGLVFFMVNQAFLVAIVVAAGGVRARDAALDGFEIRLMLLGTCVALGLMDALAISGYQWSLIAAPVPFAILRQVLRGHYRARHDRSRLNGLLNAAIEAHASMGAMEVEQALTGSARELLRSPIAMLSEAPPLAGELGAQFAVADGSRWLVVAGRPKAEPFDSADRSLLEALVAIGAGALSNAALYQEGRFQREQLSAITSSLGEGVCALDREGGVTFVNPAATAMLGWPQESASMAPNSMLLPAMRAMHGLETLRFDDVTFQRADGSLLPVAFTVSPILDDGEAVGAVIAFRDITERKAFEDELARHAFHDALTGLANRRLFIDHLDHALRRSERSNEEHAVLFADIDRFKIINDSLGHHAGDQLLVAIAERIRAALRPGDTLARFGGDEFTVLLEGVSGVEDAVGAVERIGAALRQPIMLPEGHEMVPTLSIGIALTSGKTRDDILHDADVAMYQAKAKGRTGHYEIFDTAAMGARSAERLDLESALRKALDREELEVYYQPLFDINDRRVIGAEALVRWNHPERGLLSPDEFIGLAEETGQIHPLGRFVLEQAFRRARLWRDRYGIELSMSVNLSARQFQRPGLVDEVEAILRTTQVDPRQICLEITESIAMDDIQRSSAALRQLKRAGVRLAIDDFGTGHSSLGYLKQFPVDVVKIDRSFVDGLDTNPVDSAIAAAVIGLAGAVGMTTVAEGVETLAQLEHLRSLGCPVVQGFLLGRPMPAEAIEAVLTEQMMRPVDGRVAVRRLHLQPRERERELAGVEHAR